MPLFDVLLQALKTYSDVPNGSPSVNAAEVGNLQSAPQTPMANLTAQDLNPSVPEITMQMSSLRLKDQVGIPGGFSPSQDISDSMYLQRSEPTESSLNSFETPPHSTPVSSSPEPKAGKVDGNAMKTLKQLREKLAQHRALVFTGGFSSLAPDDRRWRVDDALAFARESLAATENLRSKAKRRKELPHNQERSQAHGYASEIEQECEAF
ncbi:hypothetical protein L218DRAFT_951010 [Marasmius fiardii PR-910]|nr:hypothetical protein L218DRAFT_951010 [Marasmius fiardii PR-910]